MYTVILFILVFVFLINFFSDYHEMDFVVGRSVIAATIGLIFGIIIALCIPKDIEIIEQQYPIVSLEDNIGQSGSFYLGTGSFGGSVYYNFYYKSENEVYKVRTIEDAQDVELSYCSEPIYSVKYAKAVNNLYNKFSWGYWKAGIREEKICIPEGSIKQDYKLDLK